MQALFYSFDNFLLSLVSSSFKVFETKCHSNSDAGVKDNNNADQQNLNPGQKEMVITMLSTCVHSRKYYDSNKTEF